MVGRILHFGLGAFHRAHQASWLQDLHDMGDARWQLAGGNLRAEQPALEAALLAQKGEFTLETVSPAGERGYRRIDALGEFIAYQPGLERLLALGAEPATRIVSCTVTEAGYYLDAQGKLDATADIVADLDARRIGRAGNTLYGALAALLERRIRAGAGKLTLLSCDNLRHNGDRLQSGLDQFLALAGEHATRDWLADNSSFPNAMVDRITPRPDAEVRARAYAATGRDDPAAVMSESFRQWVIEDRFANGRPDWERVGVDMVESVLPYEEAKIRLLNASHSAIAWAGVLTGTRYIHEGVRDPRIRALVQAYATDAVIPCLQPSPLDLPAYFATVLERFGNAALADSNQRVAADSYAKLREFIVPTIRDTLARGDSIASVATLPALFLAFLECWHRGELPFAHCDASLDEANARGICAAADPARALLADVALWGELAGDDRVLRALGTARTQIAHLRAQRA